MRFKLHSFLAFSEKNKKFFYTEFGNRLNVIYGRNTSGKSTLFQLILFAFGINDDRIRLASILSEEIFVRLDCEMHKGKHIDKVVFIRTDDVLFVRHNNRPVIRFNGISANNSNEHIKLKAFIHELFNFDLSLENKNGIGKAPIETIFLPYYVSQSVGWVYLRKSFSNLDFYRNFKEDYLDYYLGIDSFFDRTKKLDLEKRLQLLNEEINFLGQVQTSKDEVKIAQITDELHAKRAFNYIEHFSQKQTLLIERDNEYVNKCNELAYYNQRLSVLSKVKRNHKKQHPGTDHCPVCTQLLPQEVENIYAFFQEKNDTEKGVDDYKIKVKKIQSEINSIEKDIKELREQVTAEYNIYKQYQEQQVTFESWINNKATLKLADNITLRLGKLVKEQQDIKNDLKAFKTEDDIQVERATKSSVFEQLFKIYINEMGLTLEEEDRFTQLYDISSFPFQGVELLQTVMCYHFAFNKLISETSGIHRLPFMLDGVFKEDVDGVNRERILKFIYKNKPTDTQTIISIADAKEKDSSIDQYNKDYFQSQAKLICIGGGTKQKALLDNYTEGLEDLLDDTYEIMEQI